MRRLIETTSFKSAEMAEVLRKGIKNENSNKRSEHERNNVIEMLPEFHFYTQELNFCIGK